MSAKKKSCNEKRHGECFLFLGSDDSDAGGSDGGAASGDSFVVDDDDDSDADVVHVRGAKGKAKGGRGGPPSPAVARRSARTTRKKSLKIRKSFHPSSTSVPSWLLLLLLLL